MNAWSGRRNSPRRSCVAGLIFMLIIWVVVNKNLYAQTQSILVLDNFENFPNNSMDGPLASFDSLGTIFFETLNDYEAFEHVGTSIKLQYDVSTAESFSGLASKLPNLDMSKYKYLSLRVKGKTGGEYVRLQLATPEDTAKVALWDYLPGGPTTDWRKVVIPLDAFFNLGSFNNITEFDIIFENYQSLTNGSPLQGELYVDEIILGSYFPGILKIDHFDDHLKSNALGGNSGEFSNPASTTLYTSQIVCDRFHDDPCALEIHYNNADTSLFGGVYFIFGGDSTGWVPVSRNLSAYDSLHLAVRAVDLQTNPGNFKIELRNAAGTNHSYRIKGINTTWQEYSVPIDSLKPKMPNDYIGQFTIVFERNVQSRQRGIAILDDIDFRAQDHPFPDLTPAPIPSALRINGQVALESNLLMNDFDLATTLNGNLDRLESVRWEIQDPLDGMWKTFFRDYLVTGGEVQLRVALNAVPVGGPVKMRTITENYNGLAHIGKPVEIIIDNAVLGGQLLFNQSFDVFTFLRNQVGVYADAARFSPDQYHPASVAAIGMGLVALCVADTLNLVNHVDEQIVQTLRAMIGKQGGFSPDRNKAGFYRHFIDLKTGARAWKSEYSTIDTGILVSGALFAKKCFPENSEIGELSDALYRSIDWDKSIADPANGGIFLTMDSLGLGNGVTRPFNEYMIVAWLAMNDQRNNARAVELWQKFYADPVRLPKSSYKGISVLTDSPGRFLSGFVVQFCHYLCNAFTVSSNYQQYFRNAARADSAWWRDNTNAPPYVWGFGAGSSGFVESGYNADDIVNHPGTICSPHIIAGFIPVRSQGLLDLIQLYNAGLGIYTLPNPAKTELLWRFSLENPAWRAGDVQGVDFSTTIFGIASHELVLGADYFSQYNDFDFPGDRITLRIDLPDSIVLGGEVTTTIKLDNYVTEYNGPLSSLRWSAYGFSRLQVTINSLTHEAIIVTPPISVLEPVVFEARGLLNSVARDTIPVRIYSAVKQKESKVPQQFDLFQSFPNPSHPLAEIRFALPRPTRVSLRVYNLQGHIVRHMITGSFFEAGYHSLIWDGRSDGGEIVTSGTYFYQIDAGTFKAVRKILVIK